MKNQKITEIKRDFKALNKLKQSRILDIVELLTGERNIERLQKARQVYNACLPYDDKLKLYLEDPKGYILGKYMNCNEDQNLTAGVEWARDYLFREFNYKLRKIKKESSFKFTDNEKELMKSFLFRGFGEVMTYQDTFTTQEVFHELYRAKTFEEALREDDTKEIQWGLK